jgi:hypothetical protein
MPGMNPVVNADHPTMVTAFQAALARQGLIVLLVFAILGLAWLGRRARPGASARRPAQARSGTVRPPGAGKPGPNGPGAGGPITGEAAPAEPAGRRVLRVGFGLLWLFDGVLQAQPKMPAGLPSQVIQPAAASSPHWVQHLVNWGVTAWSHHPVQAAAAAVWIQAGIGIWMLVAARGTWSRLSGLAGVGWGLAVWVFGGLGTDPNSMISFILLASAGYLAVTRVPAAAPALASPAPAAAPAPRGQCA